jgi:hypothetical protein
MRLQLPLKFALACLLLAGMHSASADPAMEQLAFNGHWIVNGKLSDDTDKQVERSIIAAGGRATRGGKGRYRGGPEEHALYDHISYDEVLEFSYTSPEFRLIYSDGFERLFYSDNRRRTVSASGTSNDDRQDFSFASWHDNKLLVESRVRDGGWILETYTLEADGKQLRVTMELQPSSFPVPINLTRIYGRKP